MANRQFYRSKLILTALRKEEGRRSENGSINLYDTSLQVPETSTTADVELSEDSMINQRFINESVNHYDDPVPETSTTADVELSEDSMIIERSNNQSYSSTTVAINNLISNVSATELDFDIAYCSDDSVEDPDFVPPSKKKRRPFIFDDNNELVIDFNESVQRDQPQPSPISPRTNKSIFVATYPNSVIFTNNEPARFIATYDPNQSYLIYDSFFKSTDNDTKSKTAAATKLKLKYPILSKTCDLKCIRQCYQFTQKEREDIWNDYWDMNYTSRRQFLNKCVKIEPIKQKTAMIENQNKMHNKNESRFYYFPLLGKETNVCKSFLLRTLGYKTDGVITELSRAIKRKPHFEAVKENRGGMKPVISRDPTQEHINSYNPALSHYRRTNAPLTRYLPRTLTLSSMLDDFKMKNPTLKCSLETYRKVMKQMKVSLNYPKGDQCVDCGIYNEKIKNGDESEDLKEEFSLHKTKADTAIKKYKEDGLLENSNTIHIYSMDLQKITLLPDMPKVKDAFFLSRLITFNLTFAPIKKDVNCMKSKCIIWHEAMMGREANNIVDALVTFISSERDIKHLILWCDNCTAQNKNWILFTSLITIVNSPQFDVETITLKYLTKGHTHMSADGVHGNIEKEFKRREGVFDYNDYKNVIEKSRKNIDVLEVQNSYDWNKKKRNPRKNNDPLNTFLLRPVVEAKFTLGSRNLFYKTNFEEPYQELDFLIKNFNAQSLPPISNKIPRGVKSSKKEGIVTKLVPLMSSSRREFWLNLPINEQSIDLVTGGQIISE